MANALVISGHLRTFRDIADELLDFVSKNKLDVLCMFGMKITKKKLIMLLKN